MIFIRFTLTLLLYPFLLIDLITLFVMFFFFFSSRRRHTRCSHDWSSDVCSSDLDVRRLLRGQAREAEAGRLPERDREPGARARPDRGVGAVEATALPRRVPDHARVRDPRGARALDRKSVV